MKRNRLIFLFLILLFSGFFILNISYGFFSSVSSSNSNVFSASENFPTNPSITETITPTETVAVTQTPSPTPVLANHIVISEVQINGAAITQDFIEVYNPTNSSIDLSGWKLRKKSSTGSENSLIVIGTGKSIPSYGFFLWANSADGYNATIGADVSNTNTLAGNNSIVLLKPDDSVVDQLAWGNGANQFVETPAYPNNPAAGQSIERKAYDSSTSISMYTGGVDELKGNSSDSDNNSSDFILRNISQPQNSGSSAEAL
ncbi:hypothetical protein A2767_01205 [Candidatus Roizmanbacteria bacterium RIFCSPHIGHO2_01_FULL_35_10]|nr:MAG: hypothetical protein A2767_01205 [Candidatus Roizmanbacteria bacterium RIFCSPHIGHO2_01_FULL_35_10]